VSKSGGKTTVSKKETKTTTVARKDASGKTSVTTRKKAASSTSAKSGKKVVRSSSSSARKTTATAAAAHSITTPSAQAAAMRSSVAYVQDMETSTVLFAKNEDTIRPIASISKLMTALVVVDANQPMDEMLEITDDDIDRLRHAASRLPVGTRLSRADMLHVALMSSENRAAHALGRYYPGGMPAFVKAMNAKARDLGMVDTHFVEPTGLSSENVSSPRDLVRLLRAAAQRPLIHRYTTDTEYDVDMGKGHMRTFRNTNALVRNADWDIKVSKTGFINEAGECLVMMAHIQGRDLAIVLLDSQGKYSRVADAIRIRKFVQNEVAMM
jgi:D-alanyl-D-alanine endopeptidase (penicillin-binding protein 7)